MTNTGDWSYLDKIPPVAGSIDRMIRCGWGLNSFTWLNCMEKAKQFPVSFKKYCFGEEKKFVCCKQQAILPLLEPQQLIGGKLRDVQHIYFRWKMLLYCFFLIIELIYLVYIKHNLHWDIVSMSVVNSRETTLTAQISHSFILL